MASSLMPPPPPMPPKASTKPSSSATADLSASAKDPSSDIEGVSQQAVESGRADIDEKGKEEERAILQVSEEKKPEGIVQERDERYNGARVQTSFNRSIYSIPPWSAAPTFPFSLEVIKDGLIVETLDVSSKGAYMFGRSDQCDFIMEHPSISRFHAVLQFKRTGDGFIYDLGSTHGTIVNKKKGPSELMPKEGPTKAEKQLLRESQIALDMADQEASLLCAKREALQMEGATWGMMEDAIEGEIQEEEEVTWQTYKGQLTEKQQKTLEKIHKRNEKVSSLKREIDAIQVKEIPQGGLTQGQQTQVARNQQRIEQLMEELDNLEETLNQSIQESMGARGMTGTSRKGIEGEEEDSSDDDDFYDRTSHSRNAKTNVKGGEPIQVVETAESLLEKRGKVLKEIERLHELLVVERKDHEEAPQLPEAQDSLDAFMTIVSSKLESEHAFNLRQEIEKQQADLNRIMYLLKVADPSGEALSKWGNEPNSNRIAIAGAKQAVPKLPRKESSIKIKEEESREATVIEKLKIKEAASVPLQADEQRDKGKLENLEGPLWLGHAKTVVETTRTAENLEENSANNEEFLEYKERHKSMVKTQDHDTSPDILEDASGLILRKSKDCGTVSTHAGNLEDEKRLWEGAALAAADTVALLLRHQKGLGAVVDEELQEEETSQTRTEDVPSRSKKRKLGPEKPDFLNKEEGKFQAWVPPAGQTGDGKTALNEKYGY